MVHNLEIFQKFYTAVNDGRKTFEVREKRDRNFQVGDVLRLYEINETTKEKTGKMTTKEIAYILDDENFCKKGYIILGFKM